MRSIRSAPLMALAVVGLGAFGALHHLKAQTGPAKLPPKGMARVLVISQTKGFEHDSVPDAMANIWRMGHDTRLWDTTLRTDTELITKKDIKDRNRKDLNDFEALVFASTTGELELDRRSKDRHDVVYQR